MGWSTYMANGSKQNLRSSCCFIERFAIHHQYKGLNMMVIHLFWWCLRGTYYSKHRFKSVCYLKLGKHWDVKNKNLPGWYSWQGEIRDGQNTGWWLASWVGKYPQPKVYRCLCMKTHTHLSNDILHTHTHTPKKKEQFETEGIENTWGLTATQIVINHSESFFFTRFPGFTFHLCIMSCRVNFNQRNRGFGACLVVGIQESSH